MLLASNINQRMAHVKFVVSLLPLLCFQINGLTVGIDLQNIHNKVEPEFLSFAIDIFLLTPPKWETFNFNSPRLHTLLAGLSPAYLRLGGSLADQSFFSDEPFMLLNRTGVIPDLFTYNTYDIDKLVKLVRKANLRFLMDLNLQARYGVQWDPTNTAALLGYITKMKYQDVFNFELGNEPTGFKFTGKRIGQDFAILKNLLVLYNITNCTLVGPDCVLIGTLFHDFVKEAGHLLTAATFHHYYMNGNVSKLEDFINPRYFGAYEGTIRYVQSLVATSGTPNLSIWMGEGADAWHQGTYNVTDRYVSGFLWMDKLGVSAREGLGVIIRQDLYGGYYALIDTQLMPNPDYWLSYIHKQLAGEKVLQVTTSNKTESDKSLHWESFKNWFGKRATAAPEEVRLYAHCTKASSKYKAGSVTVFGLSVKKSGSVTLTFPAPLSSQTVHVYMLTPVGPDGLRSKQVALNGETLKMVDDQTLPELVPVKQSASRGIQLAALTFGFFVFPDADAPACK